jgi:hypothetical protein
LPQGLIEDHTDAGPLWDPTLSAYFYQYNAKADSFTAYDSSHPTAYLNFNGKWGDQQYPGSDRRQSDFFGLKKHGGGPTGIRNKQLNRKKVCPDNGQLCILRPILGP